MFKERTGRRYELPCGRLLATLAPGPVEGLSYLTITRMDPDFWEMSDDAEYLRGYEDGREGRARDDRGYDDPEPYALGYRHGMNAAECAAYEGDVGI